MPARNARARAAAVSRLLAEAGQRPLPSGTSRMREGIRVSPSGEFVRVTVDHDSERESRRRSEDLAVILQGAGKLIQRSSDTSFLVL